MEGTSKRRRVDDDAADRLSELPDCILHDVLSRVGPRQAVQTSVLSRRWRHLWRDVLRENVIIDEPAFAGVQWERFEDFADHALLSIPPEKKLDLFHLNLVSRGGTYTSASYQTSSRWIRRGLQLCPTAVDIRTAHESTVCWCPHSSYFSAPREEPDLSASGCCAAGFTRRLTTLRLVGVVLSGTFVEDLGKYCPVLEDLHVERCRMVGLTTVASPTLTSLAIVEPRRTDTCAHLRIEAPLLARLRLELAYDGQECHCVAAALATGTGLPPPLALPTVAEASIRLTDTSYDGQPSQRARKKRKLAFLMSMRGLLALLPNVVKLHLAGFTTMALVEEESLEFPMFHSLKTLILEGCDLGVELQAQAGILRNTTDLEKLGLHNCTFLGPPAKKRRKRGRNSTTYVFWCEKLKSIEIKRRQEDEPHLAKVLSEISERMRPELRCRVDISSTIV